MAKGTFKIDGAFCDTVYSCYLVQINGGGDMARVKYSYNDKNNKEQTTAAKWQVIKYNRAGEPFVTFRGKKIMLDQFQKV